MDFTGKKYALTIENTGSAEKNVAIFPAYFDTLGAVSNNDDKLVLHNANAQAIKDAGFNCDVVIDDYNAVVAEILTSETGDKVKSSTAGMSTLAYEGIKVTPVIPNFTVRSFLQFIRTKAVKVRTLQIQTLSSVNILDKTLTVAQVSPMQKNGEDYIPLRKGYTPSQYDPTSIELKGLNLNLNDEVLAILPIPAGYKGTFTFEF